MDCDARESIQLKNFPIREFVLSVRKTDPEKCWPFESLCTYKDFAESMSLDNLKITEDDEAPKRKREISEGETSKGKAAGSGTRTGFELEIPTAKEMGLDTTTGSELEISKGKEIATGPATAHKLQISKGKNIGVETSAGLELKISNGNDVGFGTATATVNSKDDTSGLLMKKRKAVKVTRHLLNKKKRKRLQAEKPRSKGVKRPNLGPKGSQTMTKKRNHVATQKLAEARHSVEVEMAAGAPGSEHGDVLTGSGDGTGAAMPCGGRVLMVMVNQNPADFSAPGAGNGFMRGGCYSENL